MSATLIFFLSPFSAFNWHSISRIWLKNCRSFLWESSKRKRSCTSDRLAFASDVSSSLTLERNRSLTNSNSATRVCRARHNCCGAVESPCPPSANLEDEFGNVETDIDGRPEKTFGDPDGDPLDSLAPVCSECDRPIPARLATSSKCSKSTPAFFFG